MNGYLLRAPIALLPRLCTHKSTTTMKKENIKTIINFIITVLTAIASTFCMQSCILQ